MRTTSTKSVAILLCSSMLAVGCAAADDNIEPEHDNTGTATQAIIHGATSGVEHDEVVVLASFKAGVRKNLCTATMVAPNLLLTARHCVSDIESGGCTNDGAAITGGSVKSDRLPSNLAVFVGKNGVVPNTEVETNASARGAKLIVETSPSVCNNDIAFVLLDRKVDAPIAQIRLAAPSPAERILAVGWGVDESGRLPRSREMRNDLALMGVGPGLYPNNPSFAYGNAEFMVGESACAGDSGGPAFASRTGAVLGVASRAGNGSASNPTNHAATCVGPDAHAVYTQLGAHKALVTRAFSEAGEPMWLEGEPAPHWGAKDTADRSSSTVHNGDIPVDEPAAATGCSMTSEPQKGAVESAAGLVALLATLVGLRRRFRRTQETDERTIERPRHRERLPSIP